MSIENNFISSKMYFLRNLVAVAFHELHPSSVPSPFVVVSPFLLVSLAGDE